MTDKINDMDDVVSSFYGDDQVTAIITIKVDSKEVEKAAMELSKLNEIQDVFLVAGDTDIVIKTKFDNYQHLKEFVTRLLPPVVGLRESKTMIVVSTYKENGVRKVQ
ncbi:MAG: Lrp/AsnC family transcriptional regulator [Thermoplasmata archaeon]|jgi:DNA-binding Lrp family transcriptional regulator